MQSARFCYVNKTWKVIKFNLYQNEFLCDTKYIHIFKYIYQLTDCAVTTFAPTNDVSRHIGSPHVKQAAKTPNRTSTRAPICFPWPAIKKKKTEQAGTRTNQKRIKVLKNIHCDFGFFTEEISISLLSSPWKWRTIVRCRFTSQMTKINRLWTQCCMRYL